MINIKINEFNSLEKLKKKEIYEKLKEQINEINFKTFLNKSFENNFFFKKDIDEIEWETFLNLSNIKNLNINKIKVIKEIISDMNLLVDNLKIFNEKNLGINVEISLAGGAIRDLVLLENPKIKDLDIIVSFKYNEYLLNKMNFLEKSDLIQIADFKNKEATLYEDKNEEIKNKEIKHILKEITNFNIELKKLNIKEFELINITKETEGKDILNEYMFYVCSNILKKSFAIKEEFQKLTKNIDNENKLIDNFDSDNKYLSGVIKINDIKLNYNVDILLTSVNIFSYINSFDFSICKMQIPFISNNNIKKYINEKDFYKEIIFNKEVYSDIYNKKLSFDTDNFTKEEIEKSMEKHYPRIKEKYGEYKLDLFSKKNKHETSYLKSLELMVELKEKLKIKIDTNISNKIKI